jgi:spermidine/putrescine transport system ATP-binding protein
VSNRDLLVLKSLKKSFGPIEVLRGLDLSVGQGEFITLLGSSGCGKTTILRIIAGLESADEGWVFIDGQDVSELEPNKRGINMVFQNFALFPHMNVEQNIAYSLKLKGGPKSKIQQAVAEALALVQLCGFEKRMPDELSGGESQRVAVARAIINKPKVLLLDEPLGALDLQLRRQMQIELKRLQKQLGITFIYITHDQEEALTMSDRIAVMRNGVLEQTGSASEVYKNPKTAFIARFVGGANVFYGKVISCKKVNTNGFLSIKLVFSTIAGSAQAEFPFIEGHANNKYFYTGAEIYIAIREEHIQFNLCNPAHGNSGSGSLNAEADSPHGLEAEVTGINFAGGMLRVIAKLINKNEASAESDNVCASFSGIDSRLGIGDRVLVNWNPDNAILVDP